MSIDATVLRSPLLDTAFELWPKVTWQYPEDPIADFDEGFENPGAAARFSGSVSGGSDSAPSTPAAAPSFAFAPVASPSPSPAEVRIGGRPTVEGAAPS